MKILITGVNGQLGQDVFKEALKRKHEVIGCDILEKEEIKLNIPYYQLDITDSVKVNKLINELKPDGIIHCAAWTKVDDGEDNKEIVDKINHLGTKNIALACKDIDAKMIYISTDYVFDGKGDAAFKADDKKFGPLSIYGQSKLAGENEVSSILDKYFIVRIAWAFGLNGNNFVKTMLNLSKTKKEIRVVDDQIGTPTYTYDLAPLLIDMLESDKYGYYHATNSGGYISWYEFAKEIFKLASKDVKVIPVSTNEYGLTKAPRPLNSRLDKNKLVENGFKLLPTWSDALKRYLKEIGELNNN